MTRQRLRQRLLVVVLVLLLLLAGINKFDWQALIQLTPASITKLMACSRACSSHPIRATGHRMTRAADVRQQHVALDQHTKQDEPRTSLTVFCACRRAPTASCAHAHARTHTEARISAATAGDQAAGAADPRRLPLAPGKHPVTQSRPDLEVGLLELALRLDLLQTPQGIHRSPRRCQAEKDSGVRCVNRSTRQ